MNSTFFNDEQLSRLLTFITESDEEFKRKYIEKNQSEDNSDVFDSDSEE